MRYRERINDDTFEGLKRILEFLVDIRIDYLLFGLDVLKIEKNIDIGASIEKIDHAKSYRQLAQSYIEFAQKIYWENLSKNIKNNDSWLVFLEKIREYSRCVFISTDHIQRAWMHAQDTDTLLISMYNYLYDLYPPKLPAILDEINQAKVLLTG